MDDRQLLLSLKKGDGEAFNTIFKKFAPDLFYFSLDLMKDEAEAEEIVQETFLKVWEIRSSIDPGQSFRSFLITIAKNKIFNIFRRRLVEYKYGRVNGAAETGGNTIDENLYIEDLKKQLLDSIDRLPDKQREILHLKSQGFSNDEIAAKLGISKKTVENHLYKAYRQLRADMAHMKEIAPLLIPLIVCLL